LLVFKDEHWPNLFCYLFPRHMLTTYLLRGVEFNSDRSRSWLYAASPSARRFSVC